MHVGLVSEEFMFNPRVVEMVRQVLAQRSVTFYDLLISTPEPKGN